DDDGASTGDIGHSGNDAVTGQVSRTATQIMNLYNLMGPDDGGKTAFRMRPDRCTLPRSRERRRQVVIRDDIETVPIPQIHRAEIRPTDARGVLQHFLEH